VGADVITERIPATVITGFLGAGKTTLIRHLLEKADGRRLALIINEFGELGVDGEIVRGCAEPRCRAEDVIELPNGCICCTVTDDFVPAMSQFLDRAEPPDHIIIETSGLALPQPLVRAFQWPEIKSRVTVDGVVTVVDGAALADGRFADDEEALARQRAADPNLDHDNPIAELFEDQLTCADMVLVTKCDLLDEGSQSRVMAELAAKVRPRTPVLNAEHGRIAPSVLLGIGASAESDIDARPTHHEREGVAQHDHDDFESFVLPLPVAASREDIVARIHSVLARHDILRLKGFMAVAHSPSRLLVQAVGPRLDHWFDRPWRDGEDRSSRLVVIARKGLDRAAIASGLKA
jgi:cobalamin biosynthesis protein CobW